MTDNYAQPTIARNTSVSDRMHFKMMSLVHETLYGLFRDSHKALAAAGLEPGQNVLEVGCGPGFFTVPAARMVGEKGSVCSLDIDPLAVERTQCKIDGAGVTNAVTMLADASDTGLPDQSFDLIFVFGLAHPTGDMDGILTELHRLLRPAGTLAIEGALSLPRQLFSPLKRQGRISRLTKAGH